MRDGAAPSPKHSTSTSIRADQTLGCRTVASPTRNAVFATCLFGNAMTALIIRGGTVVNHDYSLPADVLVDGETIVAIGSALDAPAGAQVIDAGGCYVM